MSDQELSDELERIAARQKCVITLFDTQGKKQLCHGFYVPRHGVEFALDFPHGILPENLDTQKYCTFTIAQDSGIKSFTCAAKITDQVGRTLYFTAVKPADPASLRQFFRITFRVPITVTHRPELEGKKGNLFWRIQGNTVDISRTGALSILERECPHRSPLHILMELPDPPILVACVGHIVRIKRLTKTRWLTAFHFDDIDQNIADAITTNCMREQRKQIRDNVKTADY